MRDVINVRCKTENGKLRKAGSFLNARGRHLRLGILISVVNQVIREALGQHFCGENQAGPDEERDA